MEKGHEVEIFDFNIYEDEDFFKILERFKPDFVGITFVTPLIKEAARISQKIKEINEKIIIVIGGAHASSFPESSLKETSSDIAVIGEGDFVIQEIVEGKNLSDLKGIAFKQNGKIVVNERKEFIEDLDVLPYPEYSLYEINRYRVASTVARKNPVAWVETSRGCVYQCIFCNKNCFGSTFRTKSPQRVLKEFVRVKKLGFKEVFIVDDSFTTDMQRAKEICDLLILNKINIDWSTFTGIRVNRVDLELLQKMKKAGCYRVYFGIESGNQEILKRVKKGITLEQVKNAVDWSKKAGLETVGYFMFGLPGETEQTMRQTINFAKSLNLDLAKVNITIPLPATELFNELDREKNIKTYDWEKFKFHSTPSEIYNHQVLSWPTIEEYYRKFYQEVYLNPKYILRKLKNSLRNKTLIDDAKIALSTNWFKMKR